MAWILNPDYDESDPNSERFIDDGVGAGTGPVGSTDTELPRGATLNAYGQWIGSDGSYIRNATDAEVAEHPDAQDPTLTGGGTDGAVSGTVQHQAADTTSSGTTDIPSNVLDWLKQKTGLTGPQLAGLGLGGLTMYDTLNQPAYNPKSPKDLLAMQPSSAPAAFSAEQMAAWSKPLLAGNQLTRQYAADMPSPIVPGQTFSNQAPKKFAEGGEVQGPLSQVQPAFSGAVQGSGGGQSDLIDAKLSSGEYVLDAETVSMLGDGNTAAGIAKLDQLRQQLREKKRATPADDIPEEAQGPLSYIGAQQ